MTTAAPEPAACAIVTGRSASRVDGPTGARWCGTPGPLYKRQALAVTPSEDVPTVSAAADPTGGTPGVGRLLGLAWPIVISRASQVVVGLSDALLVAGLGKAALAAVTTAALDTFGLLILPMGVVFIVSSFASQLFGRGDLAGARRYGIYGLVVAAAAQLLCFALIWLTPAILRLLPYEPEVRGLIDDFVSLRLLSAGAVVGIEALANYYGALNNTRLPMLASLAAMVLNVFGNWVFIGGHLGAPALGVKGSALASSLATGIAFLALLARFIADGRKVPRGPRLSLGELGRMLRFGLPSGLNWFFEFFAYLFFINVVVAGLGTSALAAMMAVMQVNSLSFMPAFGLASAGAILVGQAIGAGAKDHVGRIVRLTFSVAAVWQGVVGAAYLLFPGALISVFVQGDLRGADAEAFQAAGTRLLMLSAAWQLFDAAATTLAEALRAAGDTAFILGARVVVAWVVFAPGAYLSVRYLHWGEGGAVFWLVLYMGLLAGILVLRFRNGAWRRLRLTDPVQSALPGVVS